MGTLSQENFQLSTINKLCELCNLCDIWRSLNPDARQFTWRDKSFKVQCRLDYFLISNELSNHASDCCIIFRAPNTDHSAVQINLIAEEFKRNKGPGFWKFNSSLLEDNRYVSQLRENILEFKSKYETVEDLGLRWDLIKMEIRGFTVKYTKIKARRRRDEDKILQNKINELISRAEKLYQSSSRKDNGT